jgi:hypothetical protein
VRVAEYTPELFGPLQEAARRIGPDCSLAHRPFVDYYYATRPFCKLYLFLDAANRVLGTLGSEQMPFAHQSRPLALGFGSNFFALQPGVGGALFLQWLKSNAVGAVFGGSRDTHRITRSQGWTYFRGVKTYYLNRAYRPVAGEPGWRAALKWAARALTPQRLPGAHLSRLPHDAFDGLAVREERGYTEDLLPNSSPFVFRCAPTLEYLRWRYDLGLSFVCYRLFRVRKGGATAGYVILNEQPGKRLVAQCDGADPRTLACAVVLSLAEAARRDAAPQEVMLTCCHPEMAAVYRAAGFRAARRQRAFALGSLRRPVDLSPDTSRWLINFDWTDNGLRPPFRDQESPDALPVTPQPG